MKMDLRLRNAMRLNRYVDRLGHLNHFEFQAYNILRASLKSRSKRGSWISMTIPADHGDSDPPDSEKTGKKKIVRKIKKI